MKFGDFEISVEGVFVLAIVIVAVVGTVANVVTKIFGCG